MARKTKEEAQNTRAGILNAALEVFYLKGVGHSSLEDIADAAGVTRGAVYWHFKNKTDIFSALHGEVHMSFLNQLIDTQKQENLNPLEQLSELCIESLESIHHDLKKKKFFTVFFLKCDYAGDLSALLPIQNEQKSQNLSITKNFFDNAIKQGILPQNSNTAILSISLLCYIGGIIHEYLRDPDIIDLGKDARTLVQFFFKKLT